MRRNFTGIALLLSFLLALLPIQDVGAAQSADAPVVHAVLFWSDGCPACHQVIDEHLPPIQARFGDQLQITLIELVTLEDIDGFYQVGAALGLTRDQLKVPFLIVGEQVLMGTRQIPDQLPGIVEDYLAAGGIDYPDTSALPDMLSAGVLFTAGDTSKLAVSPLQGEETTYSGLSLAAIIMVGMLAALVVVILAFVRAFQGKSLPQIPAWVDYSIPVLSLLGLGTALYLTFVEATAAQAVCGPVGDCNAVQSSSYAMLFGVLPVGLVGAFGYIAILVAWLWGRFRSDGLADLTVPGVFGMAFFGTLYSIYLTYVEIFVIEATCMWCLSSAVIITLIMLASLGSVPEWIAGEDQGD
jgi:uncharacterized membrane protein